jgi:hypothetical protein
VLNLNITASVRKTKSSLNSLVLAMLCSSVQVTTTVAMIAVAVTASVVKIATTVHAASSVAKIAVAQILQSATKSSASLSNFAANAMSCARNAKLSARIHVQLAKTVRHAKTVHAASSVVTIATNVHVVNSVVMIAQLVMIAHAASSVVMIATTAHVVNSVVMIATTAHVVNSVVMIAMIVHVVNSVVMIATTAHAVNSVAMTATTVHVMTVSRGTTASPVMIAHVAIATANVVMAPAEMLDAKKCTAHRIVTPRLLHVALRTSQPQAAHQPLTAKPAAPTFSGKAQLPASLVAKASRAQNTRVAKP